MVDTLSLLPFSFWVVVALLVAGVLWGIRHLRDGLGLPVIAVLGTVAAWYVGDAFYNDYRTTSAILFSADVRDNAWWQVALFLVAFLFLAPEIHRSLNREILRRPSQIMQMVDNGTSLSPFQERLQRMFWGCLGVWIMLSFVAAIRLEEEVLYYFCPYLDHRADPWARGRIGTGFDSLLSLALYLQLLVSIMFGIFAALMRDWRIRLGAVACCLLSWPYFLLDRTRNTMLAILLPGILSWVFMRLRLVMWQRGAILVIFFVIINAWFAFIIAHRSTETITAALMDEGFDLEKESSVHHEGLNMFQELCWINTFFKDGTFKPNWGENYLAELVNPIPRSLWQGKPLIGIDYAILRGQSYDEGEAGVGATISTGLIGQGVVNFGMFLGPIFAALLMSLWVVLLARFDLRGQGLGRIPLYGVGLILTFNLGRDVTLLTLYTFFFGWILAILLERTDFGANGRNTDDFPLPEKSTSSGVSRSSSPAPLSTGRK